VDGRPEIAACESGEESDVLLGKGAIQAEVCAQLGSARQGGTVAEHDIDRIPRRDVDQQENQGCDSEGGGAGDQQSLQQV
jgi:hypothetical protein